MQAVKVATKPLLLSHTAILGSRAMGPTPLMARQVSADHARAVAETGGAVGIWHFFLSLDRYEASMRLPTLSVSITSASAPTSTSRREASRITRNGCTSSRRCFAVGFAAEDAGKIAGGNYMRIFRAAVGVRWWRS